MKNHQIELTDLQEWMENNEAIYASSSREDKKLVVSMHGGFKLYHKGNIVWEGIQPYRAVEKYNEL